SATTEMGAPTRRARRPGMIYGAIGHALRRRATRAALTLLFVLGALPLQSGRSQATAPIAVAVADFDYFDTSGEVTDQRAAHEARVASFPQLWRDNLAARGDYRVVPIECPDRPCPANTMSQELFIAAARRAGARLVVYGGIRKMSTLIQWGEIQL